MYVNLGSFIACHWTGSFLTWWHERSQVGLLFLLYHR